MPEEKSGWSTGRLERPLSPAEAAALLEPWSGVRPVTSVEQLNAGLMNRNYRVRVGGDDVVLRFYDGHAPASVKETRLLRELRGIVPVRELSQSGSGRRLAKPPMTPVCSSRRWRRFVCATRRFSRRIFPPGSIRSCSQARTSMRG